MPHPIRSRLTAPALLALVAGCDAIAPPPRRERVPLDPPPARVEVVVAEDDTAAARRRFRRALGDDTLPADGDSVEWADRVIRFETVQRAALTLWAGDTVRLDPPPPPEGTPPGLARAIRWRSDEPAIATVSPAGVVTARRPGTGAIVAWRRVGQAVTPVTVLPGTRGRVLVPDADPDGLRNGAGVDAVFAVRSDGGQLDSARTDGAGRFVWRAGASMPQLVSVYLFPLGVESARYFPAALGRVLVADLPAELGIVLVPRTWRIDRGSYAGTTVAIDPTAAQARLRDGSRFWRLAGKAVGGERRAIGWAPGALPVRVALDLDDATPAAVREADSVAFWRAARQLERDWGGALFAPAPGAAARQEEWRGIAVRLDPRLPSAGFTTTTSDGDGDLSDAIVGFRARAHLRDAGIVTHELLHALGIGHTDRQESVMRASGALPTRASAEDVAYGRLLYAVRAIQARTGARYGLGEVAGRQ